MIYELLYFKNYKIFAQKIGWNLFREKSIFINLKVKLVKKAKKIIKVA
jgi:hypothetical protein